MPASRRVASSRRPEPGPDGVLWGGPGVRARRRPDPDPALARDRGPRGPVADVLESPGEPRAAVLAGRFVMIADEPGVVVLLHGHRDPLAAGRTIGELEALPGHGGPPRGGDVGPIAP